MFALSIAFGLPSRSGLAGLDLSDVAEELAQRGLLAKRSRRTPLPTQIERRLRQLWDTVAASIRPERQETAPQQESVKGEALRQLLITEQGKFGRLEIRHNFDGWNKIMQYHFPDIGETWIIRFVDGEAQAPEQSRDAASSSDIRYEMDTYTLRSMSVGALSGEQAYLRRRLRIRASFADLMRLQSLNKV